MATSERRLPDSLVQVARSAKLTPGTKEGSAPLGEHGAFNVRQTALRPTALCSHGTALRNQISLTKAPAKG